MCARCPPHLPSIHLLPQTVDFEEKARYAKWKAADIAKAFREGRVPLSGPANGECPSIGDRPISPPSDFDDLSLSSSAIGVPPSIPPEHPSPRKIFEHKLPPPTKTPLRHAGVLDGRWSTVATPGSETPGGPASPLPYSLAAVLNASQRDGSPKPRSGLNKVAAPSPLKGDGEDTDPEDGDDGWSTVGNPFSRQNSVTLTGATPPDSAGAGASFTTNLTSLSEGMRHLVTTCEFVPHLFIEPAPLHSGITATSKPVNTRNVAPTSAPSSPSTHSRAIPPSKHQNDLSKQVRIIRGTNEARASGHQRNGSSGSLATATTMVAPDTTLRSPLNDYGNGVSLADHGGTPVKAGIAPNSPSETVFGAQLPTPPSAAPKAPVPGQKSPTSKKQPSASSEEDDWEQNSLSRIARLPDSRGSDSDGKYTGGGGGDLTNPTRPAGHGDSTPIGRSTTQHGTTRGNVREDSPESNTSTFGLPRVRLPGVPSSPPVEGWPGQETYRGPPSDDGDLPNLPSAPPVAPSDQENIPHVTVFTKPRPENERQSSSNNTIHPPYDPHFYSSAPHNTANPNSWFQGHTRGLSQTSTASNATLPASYSQNHPPAPPVPKAPSPPAHFQSPSSTTSSTMPGYPPPNSVVSPTMSHTGASPSISFYHNLPPPPPVPGQQHHAQAAPSPYAHQHQQYAADPYSGGWNTAGGHPSTINRSITPQSNGSHPSSGSYFPNGAAYGMRTPPETLDPETVAKAQKHAKFAISALNFEDLDTARKELRRALEILS